MTQTTRQPPRICLFVMVVLFVSVNALALGTLPHFNRKGGLAFLPLCQLNENVVTNTASQQEVIDEENVGDVLTRMALLPEQYVGKTMFFQGLQLDDLEKKDSETFCLRFRKPHWSRKGTTYWVLCSDKTTFVIPRRLAVAVIDAGRGVFLKRGDENLLTKPETIRIGCRIRETEKGLSAIVFEIAEQGWFGVRRVLSDNMLESLRFASLRGDSNTIDALSPSKELINSTDSDGKTLLMHAAGLGHEKTVKTLLARGGDLNIKSIEGKTALIYAEEAGNKRVIKLLKKAGS